MKTIKATLLAITLFFVVSQARADMVISYVNTTISAGGNGYVDVWIHSTGTDNLYSAGFEFAITGSEANGSLLFRPSFNPADLLNPVNQSISEQSELIPKPYVFGGDYAPSNFFAVSQNADLGFFGGDSSMSAGDITLDGNDRLLARLEVRHSTGTPLAAIGDTFTISLINTLNDVMDPYDDSTLFLDSELNVLSIDGQSYLNKAVITVTAPVSVPEPSTVLFIGIVGGIIGLGRERFRNRLKKRVQVN